MNTIRKPKPRLDEEISKSRAVRAGFITFLGLLALAALFFHAKWAVSVVRHRPYGNLLNNLAIGVGLWFVHAGLSFRLMHYLNLRFVDSQIDQDHKKYF